jgi:hypothetical protein
MVGILTKLNQYPLGAYILPNKTLAKNRYWPSLLYLIALSKTAGGRLTCLVDANNTVWMIDTNESHAYTCKKQQNAFSKDIPHIFGLETSLAFSSPK